MFHMHINLKVIIAVIAVSCFIIMPCFAGNGDKLPTKKRPSVGLVLSGGGAKGFAYIGLLKVLDSVNMPIDYIGGTSIGSIMGGLYAVGYTPDQIHEIIVSQDWETLLVDQIPRKYIAYEEKEFMENSVVSLPIQKRKIGIGQSMYEGQQINLLLNEFFSPAWNVTDFKNLNTPFLCVSCNLLTGKEEVLNTGYLPMAVRSSMSIPGYFTPTHYNGKYLVDGGIIDNYPARPVKEVYGAQLLIGGNVQDGIKDTIGKLQSIASIINQIIFYRNTESMKVTDSLLDINIGYDVPAGMMDFVKYDSIIAYGERVAMAHFDELKALADSLNNIEPVVREKIVVNPIETIEISDVIYKGNKDMSSIYLNNYFGEFKNSTVKLSDIEEVVTTLYGTKFFKHVFYEFVPVEGNKANLVINLKESSPGYLSASLHYDNDYNGSLRLNGIFRNIFGDRSKLFTELVLGTSPRFEGLYLISNGSKPGLGIRVDMYDFKINSYVKDVKDNEFKLTNYSTSVFVQSIINNIYSFRGGFEYEYFRFKQSIVIDPDFDTIGNFNSYGTFFVRFRADTRDKAYFSTHGFRSDAAVSYIMPLSKGWVNNLFTKSVIFYLRYDQNLEINQKLALRPGIFVGGTLQKDNPPYNHIFGAGGLNENNYIKTLVPFTGVHFVQKFAAYSAIGRMKLQYNVYQKLYLTARADVGSVENEFEDLAKSENIMFGYGLTASYNSIIGPIEITAMSSNLNNDLELFINIGYDF